jgi:hypothetical protein
VSSRRVEFRNPFLQRSIVREKPSAPGNAGIGRRF